MADNDSPIAHCSHSDPNIGDELLNLSSPPTNPTLSPADPTLANHLPPTDANIFTNLLTSSEYLQSISPSTTKLVEIVGIVHLVKEAETVKCKNGSVKDVCTFFVHNNDGETVQCVMWGDNWGDQWNSGTTYELIIQSNTVINDLGKIQLPQRSQSTPPEIINLIDLPTSKRIVAIKEFVKTPWAVIEKQMDSTGNTCYGSIAAQKYFVDVKIADFPSNYACPFTKGQHVLCVGSMIKTGNSFFFCVQGPACITLVDQTIATLKDLLRCQPLMNRNQAVPNQDDGNQRKKLKRSEIFHKRFPKKD